MRGRTVSILTATATAACSGILGLTDPRVEDSLEPDATTEAGVTDAPQPPPLPPGPPPPTPLDAGRFCATQDATFCDDFDDEDASVAQRWSGIEGFDAGGDASLSSTTFLSPPHGAVIHANAVAASTPSGLRLAYYQVGVVPFGCELQFQPLELSTIAGDGTNVMVGVVAPLGQGVTTRLEIYIVLSPNGAVHAEIDTHPAGGSSTIPFTKTAAVGRWSKIGIQADATNVTMTLDGETIGPVAHGFTAPVTYDLYVGAHAFQPASGSTGWTLAYDDVVCR